MSLGGAVDGTSLHTCPLRGIDAERVCGKGGARGEVLLNREEREDVETPPEVSPWSASEHGRGAGMLAGCPRPGILIFPKQDVRLGKAKSCIPPCPPPLPAGLRAARPCCQVSTAGDSYPTSRCCGGGNTPIIVITIVIIIIIIIIITLE